MIKNYLKNIAFAFLSIIIFIFLLTLLNYFNIINFNITKIISIISLYLSLIITGYLIGTKAKEKGYLVGIKYGSLFMVIILLINLIILKNKFNLISILYYLLIIIFSTIGSILGIQKKK